MSIAQVPGACPLNCPDGCSWQVTVQDGEALTLRGTPDHPYTRGTLCVKVNKFLEHTRAPDRLLHPLRRTGRKGEGRFERISWDTALGEIARRLTETVERHGGEAIWPYQGTGTLGYLQGLQGRAGSRLWNVLGASRHDMTICSVAGLTGLRYTLGTSTGIDPENLVHSRLILLWGSNPLTTHHHLWKVIQRARREGARVIAIDPVRSRTAAQADEHIAPLPGTDAALALGLMHMVLQEKAEDREYLDTRTVGWEAFRRRVLEFTPRRTAQETGVTEEEIIRLGRRIADTRPTAIRVSQGIQRHAGGGATLRALACLPAVTGDWRRPGGGLLYTTDGYFGGNREALYRDDLLSRPVRSLSMTRLAEGLLETDDPPVAALVVYGANPLASSPHQNRIRRGLAREDLFTVVMDHFQTDTADYADIVLPATMQPEHLDLHDGYGHLYITWNEPAVAPPGECLSTTETFRRLARAMELTEPALYASDEELASELLDSRHPSLAGITMDTLRDRGWARLSYPERHVPFADGFPTPSGKLEFLSETARADGFDAMAGYVPAAETHDTRLARSFPFVLLSVANHFFLNTVFGNKPALRRRAGPPYVVLHPKDAAANGLASGDRVQVANSRGAFEALATIDDAVRPGVAMTTKGHWPKLTDGSGPNATVDERDADMGGGAVYHDNRVRITPLPPRGGDSSEDCG
ncbi:molybdopterin-dependent oxidoreductase [Streptomyces sp. SHP 1-2]|uniref:molybdopterin-containing oxidoreductase family protein n=1 Tax=Streptomyces sp. SHP 1-2 TaxID=2769489 RepID=UPI002237EFC3|nr:molybdopterin-dependent oxidoreductase [Streptomyces sp. SHP 1-2]MCW5254511.1 molybdopterin-dependent oxidoreductase [Streptomyces sp. SHP 1-2]